LNVSLSVLGPVQRHVLPSMHVSGMPLSQLNPGAWPRRKRTLPKPTSILASMVVIFSEALAETAGVLAGLAAGMGEAAGLVSVEAFTMAAGALGIVGCFAGAAAVLAGAGCLTGSAGGLTGLAEALGAAAMVALIG